MQKNKILTRYHGYQGTKHGSLKNSDSGVHYMIVANNLNNDEIYALWILAGGNPTKEQCGHVHDCCTCYFHSRLMILRGKYHTIAMQSWGINI